MVVLSRMLKSVFLERAVIRTPVGIGAKSRRHRRRHADFSRNGKKKNRQTAHGIARPTASPPKKNSSIETLQLGWKSVLTTLGILSLLGAGPLNRSGELIWPAERAPDLDVARRTAPVRVSPPVGLKDAVEWRADGLTRKFIAEGSSPLVNNQGTRLSSPAESARAKNSVLLRADELALVAGPWTGLESPKMARQMSLPNLITSDPRLEKMSLVMMPAFESPGRPIGLRWQRLALVETGSLGLALYSFRKFDEFFGGAQKSFRAGNDWSKDRTLHFDELLHFQGGYRIAQGLIGMYRWSGLNATWSEGLGAGTAASVMTLLEYVDGRRPKPKQGASYSDFTANLLGVGFALAKLHVNALQDVDLRLNYTSFGDVLHKRTLLKYDRMTHWLTYDLQRQWRVPLHLGIGYGVQNAFKPNVRSEYYFGIGFTPVHILKRYYSAAAKPLAWLNMYHVGWQVQIK